MPSLTVSQAEKLSVTELSHIGIPQIILTEDGKILTTEAGLILMTEGTISELPAPPSETIFGINSFGAARDMTVY